MPLPLIPVAVGAFASIISFIIRHPFVSKMMIFAIFSGLVVSATNYALSLAAPYIISNDLFALAAHLGVLEAISLYLSIVIAGFGVKQVLAFVRS